MRLRVSRTGACTNTYTYPLSALGSNGYACTHVGKTAGEAKAGMRAKKKLQTQAAREALKREPPHQSHHHQGLQFPRKQQSRLLQDAKGHQAQALHLRQHLH